MIFDMLFMSLSCLIYSMNTSSNKDKALKLQEFHGGELQELGNADQIIRIYTPIIIIQLLLLIAYKNSRNKFKIII